MKQGSAGEEQPSQSWQGGSWSFSNIVHSTPTMTGRMSEKESGRLYRSIFLSRTLNKLPLLPYYQGNNKSYDLLTTSFIASLVCVVLHIY